MNEVKDRKNRSTTYIIPILSYFIPFNKTLLINSYIYDINQPELNVPNINGIFLLFKWAENDTHKAVEDELRNHQYNIKLYDVDEEHFMVFIKFGLEIAKEIKLILDGHYSKLTDTSKNIILKYWSVTPTAKLYNILHKKEVYRKQLEEDLNINISPDAELGSVFNLHEETYSKIIKLKELN